MIYQMLIELQNMEIDVKTYSKLVCRIINLERKVEELQQQIEQILYEQG